MRVFTYLSQYPKDVGTASCWLQDFWISFECFLTISRKISQDVEKNRKKKQVTRSPKSYFAMDSVGYILNSPKIWSQPTDSPRLECVKCSSEAMLYIAPELRGFGPNVLRHVITVFYEKRPTEINRAIVFAESWREMCQSYLEVQKIPIQIVVRCFDVNRCSLI